MKEMQKMCNKIPAASVYLLAPPSLFALFCCGFGAGMYYMVRDRKMKSCFLKIIIAVAICSAVIVFLLGFIPCAADVDARNDYIAGIETTLDLRNEFAAQGVTYYGMRGHVNSYYSSFLIHTDKPCELPPAVDNYFRNHTLRPVNMVEQILYSPTEEVIHKIYKTQYYW